MTPTRKRRLIAVGLVLVAVGIAAALTVMALSQNMTYLFSPSEVLSGHAPPGSAFRLGGVVLENSLHLLRWYPDSSIFNFELHPFRLPHLITTGIKRNCPFFGELGSIAQ